jgi:hypothetical protein
MYDVQGPLRARGRGGRGLMELMQGGPGFVMQHAGDIGSALNVRGPLWIVSK